MKSSAHRRCSYNLSEVIQEYEITWFIVKTVESVFGNDIC